MENKEYKMVTSEATVRFEESGRFLKNRLKLISTSEKY